MARRPQVSRRKKPRQERSRVTVDAVLQATAQVLTARGYEGATLARIAERAGVGVGSIYQYFPSKEALLAAVAEQHLVDMAEALNARLLGTAGEPLEHRVRALVEGALAAHAREPALHRVLVHEMPRLGRLQLHQQVMQGMRALAESLLEEYAHEVREGPRALMSALLVAAVDAATHTAVVDSPELLAGPVVDEVTRLVLGYVTATPPLPPTPPATR